MLLTSPPPPFPKQLPLAKCRRTVGLIRRLLSAVLFMLLIPVMLYIPFVVILYFIFKNVNKDYMLVAIGNGHITPFTFINNCKQRLFC